MTMMSSTRSNDSYLSDSSRKSKPTVVLNPINCSIIGSDDKFKLICWVLHKSKYPFSINIKKDDMVYNLKDAIKKRNENHLLASTPAPSRFGR